MITRGSLTVLGLVLGVYGAYLLLTRQVFDQLVSAALWLAGGVILHDFVFTVVVLAVGAVGARVLPRVARMPAVIGALVLVSLTVVAFPMLGRFGARDNNATLLDRSYLVSWWALLAVVLLAVVAATLIRARGQAGATADQPATTDPESGGASPRRAPDEPSTSPRQAPDGPPASPR